MCMSLRGLKAQLNLPLKFWIVALIAFVNSVSFTIIIPILYPYAKEFGLNDFQASLLSAVYAFSQFFATPVLGRLSDFWGRKPLLLVSLWGTVLANLLASFAPVAGVLFFARILDGLTGGNTSIARAVISDTTTPAERAKAFGWFDAAFRLGFVTGPAISYFAQTLPPFPGVTPLGMSFFAGAAIALVATLLAWFLLPETLLQPGRIQLNWQIFGLGKILRSARHPRLGRVFLLTFLTGFTFTIFTFAFQPFFLNVLHQDAKALAIMFTWIGIVGVLTQILAVGPLTQRFNLATILFVAIAIRALIFLLIPTFPNFLLFVALCGLLGIANAFPIPLISAVLSLNSSEQEQGEMLGINASYLSISNALGPAVAGALVSISYSTPFWMTSMLTLLTAGFALNLRSMLKRSR
ncbi:MAG: MFS transporter [Cyanothece sp. SIO1E1]|nr:MFS transporter [Cyanothece sp. SIO1E1]